MMFTRTKIVATLGPSSSRPETLMELILAGVNVFRINFSHGDYATHGETIRLVRKLNKDLGFPSSVLVDLQGPKLRIGVLEKEGVLLKDGQEVLFTTTECTGNEKKLFITYPSFPKDVETGNPILVDDGKIKLEVIATNGKDEVRAKVVHGGALFSKKGVNLPGTKISLPCLTEKDLADLDFALSQQVDWIGLSFVRSVTDIVELKTIIRDKKSNARVIAKIEKPEAMGEIDNIIDMADGIMVARGDLGVEMPLSEVTLTQKKLVQKCMAASKPIIIATQMMESMITNFSPTRAEVSDVTNSVMDGADALMLSGETSVGKFPVEVVRQMKNIIRKVEAQAYNFYRDLPPSPELDRKFIDDSIFYNACRMAHTAKATAIIAMTHSGYSGFKVSSHRPEAQIFIFTDNPHLGGIMNLVWGVRAFFYDGYESTDKSISDTIENLKKQELLVHGDIVINIASVPIKEKGKANMIKLGYV